MKKETLHIYVNLPHMEPNYNTIGEALESLEGGLSGDDAEASQTPSEACHDASGLCFPAPKSDITPVIIHIGKGVYREKLVVTRPNLTFLGEDMEKTVLIYGQGAFETLEDGSKRGTFRTASLRIDTHDFTGKNLTIQNDAGYGHTAGQALALYVDGDRILFEDCRFLGSQDTLFTAPLPLTEMQPGGFTGPGEHKPRIMGRHCYRNCFIRGDVDFIFGSAVAWFEGCTLFSQLPMDRLPDGHMEREAIYGYVTAASTPQEAPCGYVFKDCRLTGNCPPHSVYLGRPWREWAKTVFLNCELGEHIHPLGWNDWGKPHGHFYYGEYKSYGLGAAPEKRASFSHQLTEEEASQYTLTSVLQGWNP